MSFRVSPAEFSELVEEALESLPEQFARFLEEVPVEVRDVPTPEQMRSVGLRPDSLLLGLYRGTPRTADAGLHLHFPGVDPGGLQ